MTTPVDYMQTDSKWSWMPYQVKGESATIRTSGCGITCAAMVIASLTDSKVTPVDTAKWSLAHGYKAYRQGTYYSYFTPQLAEYGIECNQVNGASVYHGSSGAKSINEKTRAAVKNGNWMICAMGKGDWTRSGHFVLWYGMDGEYALIMDPNSKKVSRRKAAVSHFQYQVKYYFEVEVDNMTQEQFDKMAETWMKNRGYQDPGTWSQDARNWAFDKGILIGGAYKRPVTREELAQVVYMYDKKK